MTSLVPTIIVSQRLLPTDWTTPSMDVSNSSNGSNWLASEFEPEEVVDDFHCCDCGYPPSTTSTGRADLMNVSNEFSAMSSATSARELGDKEDPLESYASPRSTVIIPQSHPQYGAAVSHPEQHQQQLEPILIPVDARFHDITSDESDGAVAILPDTPLNMGAKADPFRPATTTSPSSRPAVQKSYSYCSPRNVKRIVSTGTLPPAAPAAKSLSPPPRPRRCHSFPTNVSNYWLEERRLQIRRSQCQDNVQKLYEDRKDKIEELFQNQWILSDDLDDYMYE